MHVASNLSLRLASRDLLGCDVVVEGHAAVQRFIIHPVVGQWRGDQTQLLERFVDALERRGRVRRAVLVGVEVKRAAVVRFLDASRSELWLGDTCES